VVMPLAAVGGGRGAIRPPPTAPRRTWAAAAAASPAPSRKSRRPFRGGHAARPPDRPDRPAPLLFVARRRSSCAVCLAVQQGRTALTGGDSFSSGSAPPIQDRIRRPCRLHKRTFIKGRCVRRLVRITEGRHASEASVQKIVVPDGRGPRVASCCPILLYSLHTLTDGPGSVRRRSRRTGFASGTCRQRPAPVARRLRSWLARRQGSRCPIAGGGAAGYYPGARARALACGGGGMLGRFDPVQSQRQTRAGVPP
jgi:hypothetical protein